MACDQLKRSKNGEIIIRFLSILGILLLVLAISCYSKEKQRDPIEIPKQTTKELFFYRDDCNDCKAVFPKVYIHNLVFRDTIFVNLNNKTNQKYIHEYHLSEVPHQTIINN